MQEQNIIRISRADFEVKRRHFLAAGNNESQMFTLFTRATGRDYTVYINRLNLVPDPEELRNQSSVSIEPAREFQTRIYGLAHHTGMDVGDDHTHPFTETPQFSAIDNYHGKKAALYLSKRLPQPTTMLMTVFGRDLKHFQAHVWNRKKHCFEPVKRLEIIGSPMEILCEDDQPTQTGEDPYARHRIIPGWKQTLLGKLKVFLAGLGGNGAAIWQSLVGLGVGRNGGWLRSCDDDRYEASNLPRIPYATPEDIGKAKAVVAQQYAKRKAPELNVSCYCDSVASERMQHVAKEANVIVGALDNDGARKIMNQIACRYQVVYLDLSAEIIPENDTFEAVGQVRVVIPGKTGCLICSGMIDASEAALDLMPDDRQRQRARVGYVRGSDETPTASVSHLNGVTAHLAVSQFLRVVFGEGIDGKDFLHYDRQNCQLVAASCPPVPKCPVCGIKGYLSVGDEGPQTNLINGEGRIGRFTFAKGNTIENADDDRNPSEENECEASQTAGGD